MRQTKQRNEMGKNEIKITFMASYMAKVNRLWVYRFHTGHYRSLGNSFASHIVEINVVTKEEINAAVESFSTENE